MTLVYHPETETVTMDLSDLRDLYDIRDKRYCYREEKLLEEVEDVLNEGYGE